ncbi:MAG: hypothetical protein RLZZ15_746 [Verrucomicrobiota bacterium]|jgi:hypothetical protein
MAAKLPSVDTKDAPAVAAYVAATFARLFPDSSLRWIETIMADMRRMFEGRHPEYSACDVRYHDFEHTLQATVCITLMLEGRHLAGVEPRLTARHFELAVAAVLLHDAGYLKLRSDSVGTGAKYTFCHVLRSCAYAASYLPSLGANDFEVEAVLGAINCTGPTKDIARLRFRDAEDRVIGCALATADYLAQMAAADYPDELEILFDEFKESDDYIGLAPERRAFSSAADLAARTPIFWQKFVRAKLESDFQAVYRFLARPYPQGSNAYILAVEKNIAIIERRAARAAKTTARRSR